MQCVAVFGTVLQCCSVLQCVAACGKYRDKMNHNMCVAVCCSVLRCLAVCCSNINHRARHSISKKALQCVAVCCSVLQCLAVCCSVLQCVAACGRYRNKMNHKINHHTRYHVSKKALPLRCERHESPGYWNNTFFFVGGGSNLRIM